MSDTNGHTLDELREQTRLARARSRLAAAKAEAHLAESLSMDGMGFGTGWSDILDPFSPRNDGWSNLFTPQSAGTMYANQDGRDRPFVWTEIDLDRQRSLAIWLYKKNGIAQGAVRTLVNFIAKTGYTWEAKPAHRWRDDPHVKALAQQVQDVIDEFSDRNTLKARECSAVRRGVRDGEVFTRSFDQGDGTTTLRFIEPAQVRQPPGTDASSSLGIETDPHDVETPLTYWTTYDGTEYDAIPAEDVCHLKRNVDECHKRGISDFLSTGELLDTLQKLVRNMGAGAAAQSAIAWIEQFKQTTATQASSHIAAIRAMRLPVFQHPISGRDMNRQHIEPGTVVKVDENREYIPAPLAQNSSQHTAIIQAIMRFAGARWNMPEYMISGDASNANYASTMVAGSPFVTSIECEQEAFGQLFLKWRWQAIRNACRAGRIRGYSFEQVEQYIDLHFTPPQAAIANEQERAQVDHQDIAAGVMSLQTRRARRGLEDDQERANLKEEPITRVQGRATDIDPSGNPKQPDDSPQANGGLGQLGETIRDQVRTAIQEVMASSPFDDGFTEGAHKPGDVWQGQSGRWFTITSAGHVAPAAAPGGHEEPVASPGGSKADELHAAHSAHEEAIEQHHEAIDKQTARVRQKEDRQIDRTRQREDAAYERQMDRKRAPQWERLDRVKEKSLAAATSDQQKQHIEEQYEKEFRRLYDKFEAEDAARHQQADAQRDEEDAKREAGRDREDAQMHAQRQAEEKERHGAFLALLDRAEEDEVDESLQPTLEDLLEAQAQKRKIGEVWQGPSKRWFTINAAGRAVPAKNPNAQEKAKGKLAKPQKADPETAKGKIRDMLAAGKAAGKMSPDEIKEMAAHIMSLTVPHMDSLKKELNLPASGPKAEKAIKMMKRALAAVAAGKGKEKPKEPAAAKEQAATLTLRPDASPAAKQAGSALEKAAKDYPDGKVPIGAIRQQLQGMSKEQQDRAIRDLIGSAFDPEGNRTISPEELTSLHRTQEFTGFPPEDAMQVDFGGNRPLHWGWLEIKGKGKEKPKAEPKAKQPPADLDQHIVTNVEKLLADKYADDEMVPIHDLRKQIAQQFGEKAASREVFDKAMMRLRADDKLHLVAASDLSAFTPDQLANSVQGMGEVFTSVRPTRARE